MIDAGEVEISAAGEALCRRRVPGTRDGAATGPLVAVA